MELQIVSKNNVVSNDIKELSELSNIDNKVSLEIVKPPIKAYKINPFIEANTNNINLSVLKNDCIIPVFSKDNEKTIAHQEFIDITSNTIAKIFPHHTIELPEIRTSHQIKGRTADAIHKSVKELLDHEKTQYFERMAFIIRIPSITETINGQELSLVVGGVRAYNKENLYSRKSYEKFQIFIGFQNMVCCNLCISTDGFKDEIRVGSLEELQSKIMNLIQSYNAEKHLEAMREQSEQTMTETQFAQMIGKARLYNYLPKEEKAVIPELMLIDSQISTIAKDYYNDANFNRNDDGTINLWNVYNLFTGANKGSYIDSFLSRNVNAFNFSNGLADTLKGDNSYQWFLN